MTILSSFLTHHILSMLEQALVEHEPALQAAFLREMQTLFAKGQQWINNKLDERVK